MNEQSIDIDGLVHRLIDSQEKVAAILKYELDSNYNDETIIKFFLTINDSLYANAAISKKVADYLQLLNKEENYKQVTLEQIKQVYEWLIITHPFGIELYESLAWYLNNVLDLPDVARETLKLGILKVETKLKELKSSLIEFN